MANTETAVSLMKMALALLDAEGELTVAAALQHAISIAEAEPIPQSIEEAEAMLASPAARALVQRIVNCDSQ